MRTSNWIISPSKGENKTYLRPPPRTAFKTPKIIWFPTSWKTSRGLETHPPESRGPPSRCSIHRRESRCSSFDIFGHCRLNVPKVGCFERDMFEAKPDSDGSWQAPVITFTLSLLFQYTKIPQVTSKKKANSSQQSFKHWLSNLCFDRFWIYRNSGQQSYIRKHQKFTTAPVQCASLLFHRLLLLLLNWCCNFVKSSISTN